MIINVAIYRIRPEHVSAFVKRVARHAETSMRDEPGCVQFDVNQSRDDPSLFLMYEGFRDAAAVAAHGSSPHVVAFLKERDEQGWLADRTVYSFNPIYPARQD